jgi:hypothetical protein
LQKRNNERVALGKIKRREELATLEQIVVDWKELTAGQLARLEVLQSAKKRQNEADRLSRQAKCQKKECVETRELNNSDACTLCNKLFSTKGNMQSHTRKYILRSHFFLWLFYYWHCTRFFCSESKSCFKSIRGEEHDDLLNNVSVTMTKPLGIEATARPFEVTFPPMSISESSIWCVLLIRSIIVTRISLFALMTWLYL